MKKLVILSLAASMMISSACFAQNDAYIGNDQAITLPAVQHTASAPINADVQSIRVPAGTKLKVRAENSINSEDFNLGSTLIGTLAQDVKIGNKVALPYGTQIRANIISVKKSFYLSRGGQMGISFDYVVTPLGSHIPITARLSKADYLTPNGDMDAKGGYFDALGKNVDKSTDLTCKITSWGTKEGLSFGHGYPVILTAPLSAFTGVAVGGGMFFVNSVKSIFKKGENVKIQASEIIEATITQPMDIPVN